MNDSDNKILEAMDPDFDGSESDLVLAEEAPIEVDKAVGDVVGKVRKETGLPSQRSFRNFTLGKSGDDYEGPRKRRKTHSRPEDPAVLRSLKAAELLRESAMKDGTHFSVRNLMERVEVPEGATHRITMGALEGQYVKIMGNGEKGSMEVTIVGGRRNGSRAFIMPADLKKL